MADVDPVASLGRLALSLGVIVGALLLVRHWAQRGRGVMRNAGGVRVLARAALTRTSAVAVVEADGRRFLVGAAEDGIRLLTELDPVAGDGAADGGVPVASADLRAAGSGRRSAAPHLFASPTDGGALRTDRPGTGLLDRLRAMTVRTHVDRPIRVPLR